MADLPSHDEIQAAVHDADRLAAVRTLNDDVHLRRNPVFDRLSRQASELLGTPLALISLVEEDFDVIYGQTGLPHAVVEAGQIDAMPSFCQLTITADKPVVIADVQQVPTLRLFPSVTKLGVRAHLGIPLQVNGQPVGNPCVTDFTRRQWTPEDVAALADLAAAALRELTAVPTTPH